MMLPRDEDMGKIPGLDISGSMQPAAEVGGDYYDVIGCHDGGVVCAIGDVTGHGLESGVIAIMVQTAVRTLLASEQFESKKFLNVLNGVIYDNVRRMRCDRNLTLSLLRYQDKIVTISGQHEEVLVVRAQWRPGTTRHPRPWFSAWAGAGHLRFHSRRQCFLCVPATSWSLTPDGITEAINDANVPFGIERVCEAVRTSHGQPADVGPRSCPYVVSAKHSEARPA